MILAIDLKGCVCAWFGVKNVVRPIVCNKHPISFTIFDIERTFKPWSFWLSTCIHLISPNHVLLSTYLSWQVVVYTMAFTWISTRRNPHERVKRQHAKPEWSLYQASWTFNLARVRLTIGMGHIVPPMPAHPMNIRLEHWKARRSLSGWPSVLRA